MASWLVRSGVSGPGSNPGRGHCVAFLGKTLYSHNAPLHLGVYLGTVELTAGWKPCNGLASHPGRSRNTLSRFMLQKPGWAPAWWATWLEFRLYNTSYRVVSGQILVKVVKFEQPINSESQCGHSVYSTAPLPRPGNDFFFRFCLYIRIKLSTSSHKV